MSGPRVKRRSFSDKVKPIEWQDCLLPKPNLEPPVLVDFLGTEWQIVAWDGVVLDKRPNPIQVGLLDQTIRELLKKFPNLQIPNHILDQAMDIDD